MAINGFRLSTPFLSSSFLSTLPPPILPFYLPDHLPLPLVSCLHPLFAPLSHFSPLIHLSDFTRTQGDPGQTSCRGNRQSRNILYFLFFIIFTEGEREREERLKSI